jgi:hypothetical protein
MNRKALDAAQASIVVANEGNSCFLCLSAFRRVLLFHLFE